ncbi:MAG: hypothetical protein K8I00_01240, partial [Candidatus Omnitrophica bacterium]|nr:hypothetical protein [Candidatus Omnitrophota bacterium]
MSIANIMRIPHIRPALLFLAAVLVSSLPLAAGMGLFKSFIVLVFLISILGSLFYWERRLGFMFIGNAIYLLIGAVPPEDFIRYASLEVILFLISMMIVVGMMKDAGLFEWLLMLILRLPRLTGRSMFMILMVISAIFSALMGEVASIMIMAVTIINICDLLEIDPVPLVICCIMATNIGSAATVLGNPVGILIASNSGLSFEDFLIHAMPNVAVNLVLTLLVLLVIYRRYLNAATEKLREFTENHAFIHLITIPSDRKTKVSIGIFAVTIILIALHRRLEMLIGLEENTLLLMFPILSAGVVLMYRYDRSRRYIENEIEWPSIIFFMFLFAQAGVIHATGVAETLAKHIFDFAGSPQVIQGLILISSGLLSSILDNVVAVATYIPLIKELMTLTGDGNELWWPLLYGACYGGNITMIGSTANIVA